jgi:simple sugar transport system ATP-binding protein
MVGTRHASPRASLDRVAAGMAAPGEEERVLEVEGLSLERGYKDVAFAVRRGECVGLAGLVGSGKELVGDTIAGFVRPDSGTVRIAGRAVPPNRVDAAIRAGVGYVPEDRYERGFVPLLAVAENLTMPIAMRLGRGGLVSPRRRHQSARTLIEALGIKVSSPAQPIAELSGGNQQKATLGRALSSDPKALVLMQPTSGVDIASKEALFGSIVEVQKEGAAVLVVSDEIEELRICGRVLVMFKGRIAEEFAAGWAQEDLIAAMEGWRGAEDGDTRA